MRSRFATRSLTALLFVALVGTVVAVPAAARTTVSVTVSTDDPKAMAGLLIGGIMAAFFNAQGSGAAIRTVPQPRDPWADLPYWYVASWADVPVERIVELRRQGRRWVEIVEYCRLPQEFRGRTVIITGNPAGKVKVKAGKGRPVFIAYTDQEFERFIFVRFLEDYYAVPRATIVVWLDRGLSLQDVFLSVNLATRARVQPDVIIRYRLSGEPWDRIARRYRVEVVELGRPVVIEHKNRRHLKFNHWDGKGDWDEQED